MFHRPILREDFAAYTLANEGHVLLSDTESFALEGGTIDRVLPLLNGRRTRHDIATALADQVSATTVYQTLDYLADAGHLREADPFANNEQAVFWSSLGVDTETARARFASSPVEIHSVRSIARAEAADWFSSMGMWVQPAGAVAVVFADDYLAPELESFNQHFLERGLPWLLVRPAGLYPLIGPLFVPGRSGCWACLRERLRENRSVEMMLAARLGVPGVPQRPIPTATAFTAQVMAEVTVQLASYIIIGTHTNLEGVMHQLNPTGMAREAHILTQRPQCPACGTPDAGLVGGTPIHLIERRSAEGVENGERVATATETFNRYRVHISPLTGVVKALTPSPYNNISPLRSYSAGNNLAFRSFGIAGIKHNLRSFSSGKGFTDEQALTSALCEALERYCGKYRGEEVAIPGARQSFGDAAIHPNEVMLYSDAQYRDRDAWNARGSQFQIVPDWLHDDEPTHWSPVWSYTQSRVKYLPSSLLFYSYPTPQHRFTSWADSNGAAAGSTFEDAFLQGLLELVERDSVALWWYNRLTRPGVDLSSIDDPLLRELETYYSRQDREFWVLDLTSDIDIPSFVALNRRVSGPTEDIVLGFGAHLDARTAIFRAVTEMNQFMPAVLNVDSDGVTQYAFDDPGALQWWQTATLANQPYLQPRGGSATLELSSYADATSQDITETLREAIRRVERRIAEVLVLDQTRVDIGLPVVKVLAPGMRHFWARFAPGRLYDVPVSLADIEQPRREDELNPTAMFL